MPWSTHTVWEPAPYVHYVIGVYKEENWYVRGFQHQQDAEAYVKLLNDMLAVLRRHRELAYAEWGDRQSGISEPYNFPQGLDTPCYNNHLGLVFFNTKDALAAIDEHFAGMMKDKNGPMYPFRRIPDEYRYTDERPEDL